MRRWLQRSRPLVLEVRDGEKWEGPFRRQSRQKLAEKMGDGVWVVSQRRTTSHLPSCALTGPRRPLWRKMVELTIGFGVGFGLQPWPGWECGKLVEVGRTRRSTDRLCLRLCIHVCTPNSPGEPLTTWVRVGEGDSLSPPPDLDPLELSTGEELSLYLGNSTTVNCSVQGLPTPALRWTKVRRRKEPPALEPSAPHPRPCPHSRLASPFSPCQDFVPLGNGPTLSLSSITFDSAGTYVCEASMPTVPLLSRTQSFKLLVQGSGWGRFGWGPWGWGGARTNDWSLCLLFLSPLSFSFSPPPSPSLMEDGPPALPHPPPPGPPQLSPEEPQPQTGDSWREGEEVRLVCSARGYPEPKLSWSQLGGSVRDGPLHPEPCGTQAPLPKPLGGPCPLR